MRHLFSIAVFLIIIITFSCKEECEQDLVFHKLILNNEIGELSICLATEYDTLYSIVAGSDYNCGAYQFYIIQPKTFPTPTRSSYLGFNQVIPDSVYEFSIRHKFNRECDAESNHFDIDSLMVLKQLELNQYFIGRNSSKLKKETINGLEYLILESIDTSKNMKIIQSIVATTYYNNSILDLRFTKTTHENGIDQNFIFNSNRMLSTVELK